MIILQQDGGGIVEVIIFVLFIIIAVGAKLFEWIRKLGEGGGDSGERRPSGLKELLEALKGEEETEEEAPPAQERFGRDPEAWEAEREFAEPEPPPIIRAPIRTTDFEAFAEKVREKERLAREAIAEAARAREEAEVIPVLTAAVSEEVAPAPAPAPAPRLASLDSSDLRGGVRWAVILGSPRGLQAWGEDGGLRPMGL